MSDKVNFNLFYPNKKKYMLQIQLKTIKLFFSFAALQSTERQCLKSSVGLTSQIKVKDHPASLAVTFDQHFKSPNRCLDWNKRYRSVAIQIPYDAGLSPISYTGRKFTLPPGNDPAHTYAGQVS